VVGALALLIPVLILTALAVWGFTLVQRRRQRSMEVVTWLQAGLAGRGRVLTTRWVGPMELLVQLDLESHRLYGATAQARLGGPTRPDRMTLRCDLDVPPRYPIEVACERWKLVPADAPPAMSERPGAQTRRLGVYIITSEQRVAQNYRELIRSLLNSPPMQVERLLLSPVSPHLELTIYLNFASPPPPGPLFRLLHRLADVVPQHSR